MRSSLWRFNPKANINFNDQSLDCGGPQIQFNLNRGRCGVCGDPYNEGKENEQGGRYDSGIIARRYRTGTKVTMIADLVAGNGGGYFEVKLCPRNNPKARVTQACFDKYPLQIKNGNKNKRLRIPKNSDNPTGLYRIDVKLPKGVACTHCVIQWHYHASNEWGYDSNGRGCMGCGPQTEIYNCADVSIGYYGDPEGKLGQTADISMGTLADVYNVYANGQYGTGVSPLILNSGINSGWASANDLTNNNENENEEEADDDQPMMASTFNRQSAGFANLFIGGGGAGGADYDFNMMSFPDYYGDYGEGDYGLNLDMNMLPLLMGGEVGGGGGGGGSGEDNSFDRNTGRFSFNMRSLGAGGGSGGSSEEGGRGVSFSRNFAINIPSLSRQYNMMNGGGSGSSEEQSRRPLTRNIQSRTPNLLGLRDALRDITNRQKLRNGLHDIVDNLNDYRNRNNNNNNVNDYYDQTPIDYYDTNVGRTGRAGGDSSEEGGFNPGNIPTYFRDRLGGSGGSSDCSGDSSSSEESGCGDRRRPPVVVDYPQEPEVIDYYDYPDPPVPVPEVTTPPPPPVVIPEIIDTGPNRGDNFNLGPNGLGLGGPDDVGVMDYGDIVDPVGGVNQDNIYQTQEDIDFIANRQAEFDRWNQIQEEERLRLKRLNEKPDRWQPPMLPPWPYNNVNLNNPTGLFPQQTNPYGLFNTGINNNMNTNLNLIPGMNSIVPPSSTLSRQYPPWQLPNLPSTINSPSNSRLGRPFPQMAYASEVSESQDSSPLSKIFSWMPSANDVMSLGASKSPIFSQKVANHYLSPFLTLSQSHPSLRCERPDQLVCVATPDYSNIPDADNICTSKCRSGGACGSDYCSCACQKSLMCFHQSSGSELGGQMGVTELDIWCTEQCNAGQCPNQVCACTMLF